MDQRARLSRLLVAMPSFRCVMTDSRGADGDRCAELGDDRGDGGRVAAPAPAGGWPTPAGRTMLGCEAEGGSIEAIDEVRGRAGVLRSGSNDGEHELYPAGAKTEPCQLLWRCVGPVRTPLNGRLGR